MAFQHKLVANMGRNLDLTVARRDKHAGNMVEVHSFSIWMKQDVENMGSIY